MNPMMRSLVPFQSRSGLARQFNPFDMLQREIDRLFDDVGRGFGGTTLVPQIEVAETDNAIEITAELPGLERGDVDVSLEGNRLIIRAEKKAEQKRDDKNVHLTERSYGVFYRVLELPAEVDPASVQATMSNGVLKITVPKPARAQTNKIEVKQGQDGGQGTQAGEASGQASGQAGGQAEQGRQTEEASKQAKQGKEGKGKEAA